MKKAVLIARLLLGLSVFGFGLNNVLHFLKISPGPPSDATTFNTILVGHGYMSFVGILMVVGGVLLLVGRFVPLGLVLLGPVLINILLYHALIAPEDGIGAAIPGLVLTLLEIFVIWAYRRNFSGLFAAAPEVS